MKIKLMACPFCGGKAAKPDVNDHTWCEKISCGSDAYMSVKAWNTRYDSEGRICPDTFAIRREGK